MAILWLNQALCFYQSLCLTESEVLRNRHLRVAAKRYARFFEITKNYHMKQFLSNLLILLTFSSAGFSQVLIDNQVLRLKLDSKPNIKINEWIANVPSEKNLIGKFLVIEFWATWCKPCLDNVAHLNELQSKFNNPNLYFLSLTDESPTVVKNTLQKVKFNSIVVSDNRKVNSFWNGGINKLILPLTILVDNNGIIKWIGQPSILTEKIIRDLVNSKLESYNLYEPRKK